MPGRTIFLWCLNSVGFSLTIDGIFGENRSDAAYFEKDRFFCVRFKREYN